MQGQRQDAIARRHINEVVGRGVRPSDNSAGHGALDQRNRREVPAVFLGHQGKFDETGAVTSHGLGKSHRGTSQRHELLPEIPVEADGFGVPHPSRRAFLRKELCEHLAHSLLLVRQ
jgi:hypothetical protein